ncbi:hypothetical protein EV426DRAFT_62238 [Tirmania nivea]|nr:hypothetical protein EV426DRAFT_62238 [Tirmania nivea]
MCLSVPASLPCTSASGCKRIQHVGSSLMYMYSTKNLGTRGWGHESRWLLDGYHRVRLAPTGGQTANPLSLNFSCCEALFSAVDGFDYSACWHSSPQICTHILKIRVTYCLLSTNKYTHSFLLTPDRNRACCWHLCCRNCRRMIQGFEQSGGLRGLTLARSTYVESLSSQRSWERQLSTMLSRYGEPPAAVTATYPARLAADPYQMFEAPADDRAWKNEFGVETETEQSANHCRKILENWNLAVQPCRRSTNHSKELENTLGSCTYLCLIRHSPEGPP